MKRAAHAALARARELLRPGHEGAGEHEVDHQADHRELDGRPRDPRLDGDHDDPCADLSVPCHPNQRYGQIWQSSVRVDQFNLIYAMGHFMTSHCSKCSYFGSADLSAWAHAERESEARLPISFVAIAEAREHLA